MPDKKVSSLLPAFYRILFGIVIIGLAFTGLYYFLNQSPDWQCERLTIAATDALPNIEEQPERHVMRCYKLHEKNIQGNKITAVFLHSKNILIGSQLEPDSEVSPEQIQKWEKVSIDTDKMSARTIAFDGNLPQNCKQTEVTETSISIETIHACWV